MSDKKKCPFCEAIALLQKKPIEREGKDNDN